MKKIISWMTSDGQGPWGGFGGGSSSGKGLGKDSDPWGKGRPNVENFFENIFKERGRTKKKGGGGLPPQLPNSKTLLLGGLSILVLWCATGFYRVQPDEQGVVLRFGRWVRTDQSGLNYHLPNPIETVELVSVTRINRIDVGFRSGREENGRQTPEESLMLTGDENIVDINFTVFWRIKDAGEFLFNMRAPEEAVKSAAESAMREIIGQTPIAEAMAEGRSMIETRVRTLMQNLMDQYGAGIEVTEVQLQRVDPPQEVIDAFRDVQRARADLERLRNDAEAYRNKIIPEARGDAELVTQAAQGYKQSVVARAQGQANRFVSVYGAYAKAPEVTQKRLYLETIEKILGEAKKVILDKNAQGSGGVLPYLPLDSLGFKASKASEETKDITTGEGEPK